MANPSPSRPKQEWFLDAKCEVHLPFNAALFGKANDFDDLILNCPNVELSRQNRSLPAADPKPIPSDNTDTTLAKDTPKPTKAIPILLNRLTRKRLFDRTERDNLERASDKLAKELDAAWKHDPLLTLKLIFRSRSIRFGEGSRHKLYRCAGWLYRHHPRTLMTNLQWLVRPVPGVESTEGPETSGDPSVKFSLENRGEDESGIADGASHGYWKDLLNILALAANDMLKVTDDPKGILNIPKPKKKSTAKPESRNKSKSAEFRAKRRKQHDRVVRNFEMVSVKAAKYKVLHLQIARLFADQLRVDIERLRSGDPEKQKRISLCAKWAPSTNRFHDRHTFVVSSIAERLYHDADEPSLAECKDKPHKRTEYLRRTRELYRKDCSLLRKHLDIVERHMSSKALNLIDYQQVPSVAMSQYSHLFAVKDGGRFEEHVTEVVSGKMQRIKDVPKLLPGQLVLPIRALKGVHLPKNERKRTYKGMPKNENKRTYKDMVTDAFNADKVIQVTDLQKKWDKLVTRMKESSILQDSMVVCDVSSQMMNTVFSDKTTALDIAMGLSLLIAYTNDTTASSGSGGSVLPFASESKMEWIDLKLKDTIDKSLEDTWCLLKNAVCEDTLALDAVFLKGILPGALKSNEARIPKRVFVFTVRSLEESVSGGGLSWTWASGHPLSVREKFANAKLDIPEVIFWNLATNLQPEDDARIASYYGVERVNGYSLDKLERYFGQALFENGKEGVEQVGRVSLGEENKRKKRKIDPHERVSNRAFEGLRIVD
ncbi:hypothetical protein QBC35DRAFT_393281 [Podospora australis]|uniref:Uncharacterized protein n=1 Tax=Podospora australis TaxID=1536484 RepID=A0AAN7AE06_9PEZI|nr:hypothetical protein QBC35DRAFT_393281 [Podospora australis]